MIVGQVHLETPDERHDLTVPGAEVELPLSELLARRGFPLNTRCGGRGLCGGCEVALRAGSLRRIGDGASVAADAAARLKSCQLHLGEEPVEVTVPARSLLRHKPAVVAEFRLNIPWAHDPLIPEAHYGAAVDIGTTTVALLLCELATGGVIGKASAFNAQIRFGEDVLTRIQLCSTNQEALSQLQRAVAAETINPSACRSVRPCPGDSTRGRRHDRCRQHHDAAPLGRRGSDTHGRPSVPAGLPRAP